MATKRPAEVKLIILLWVFLSAIFVILNLAVPCQGRSLAETAYGWLLPIMLLSASAYIWHASRGHG